MKAKFLMLFLLEALCLAVLFGLVNTPFTLRTAVALSEFNRSPTEEYRNKYEGARRQDQRNLMVQLLWRTAAQLKRGQTGQGSAQPGFPSIGSPTIPVDKPDATRGGRHR